MCADGQWAGVHQILRARQTQRDGFYTVPKSTLRKRNSTQANPCIYAEAQRQSGKKPPPPIYKTN